MIHDSQVKRQDTRYETAFRRINLKSPLSLTDDLLHFISYSVFRTETMIVWSPRRSQGNALRASAWQRKQGRLMYRVVQDPQQQQNGQQERV